MLQKIKKIIHRELANFECQIVGDITDAYDILKDYGITKEQVLKEYKIFYQKCIKNDWFYMMSRRLLNRRLNR